MPKLLEKQALASDLAAVTHLLESRSSEEDPMGRLAYEQRKRQLEEELASLDETRETLASVALLFSGRPVFGSQAIDASFAAAALGKYQDIVARLYADQADESGLPERGPIPHRDLSALQITDVAHGSFGFVLSEQDTGQLLLFDTSIKQTLDRATALIAAFCAPEDDAYAALIETINRRVFGSTKDFFAVLREAGAAVRLVEGDSDEAIDYTKVERAFDRSQQTTIEEEEDTLEGVLIGILPTPMQFEFQPDGREPISGRTGPSISRTYLERINADERTVGSRCVAKILTRTTVRPTGQTSRKYTLLDLSIP